MFTCFLACLHVFLNLYMLSRLSMNRKAFRKSENVNSIQPSFSAAELCCQLPLTAETLIAAYNLTAHIRLNRGTRADVLIFAFLSRDTTKRFAFPRLQCALMREKKMGFMKRSPGEHYTAHQTDPTERTGDRARR